MERFADPKILETMTLGEKLFDSAIVMLLGMGITFVVLIALMYSINLLRLAFQEKKQPVVNDAAHPIKPAAAPAKTMDDDELIAVITAALAASQDDVIAVIAGAIAAIQTPGTTLRIQSIRRVSPPMPAWAQSGLAQNMRRI